MDIVSTIDHSLTLVKRLREISKNIAEAEFRNLLADLSNELGDAKLEIASLKQQLADQAEEIATLKAAPSFKRENIRKHQSVYWLAEHGSIDGPFCTECLEHTNKLVTLRHMGTLPVRGGSQIIARYACTFHPQLGAVLLDAMALDQWKAEVFKS